MIEHLLPHVRQFVQVRRVLADARALSATLTQLLDNSRLGVTHLDRRRRIAAANDVALRLLREGDSLYDDDGRLRARANEKDAELQGLVADALPPNRGQGRGRFNVRRVAFHFDSVGPSRQSREPRRPAGALPVPRGRRARAGRGPSEPRQN